jgi:hypothetical protein
MSESLYEHRTPVNYCPKCGYRIDAASVPDKPEEGPEAGDFSVCLMCGCMLRFEADLRSRKVTMEELETMDPETLRNLVKMAAAVVHFNKLREKGRIK